MLSFGSLLLAAISVSQAIVVRKEHSISPPYVAGSPSIANWDLTGSAELQGIQIRLTPDEGGKKGAIWNNFPCFSNNWEFQVQFLIHGKGVNLFGDGMALWYVHESDMLHNGPVFGSKDYFSGLGIFIDTFANQGEQHKHRHPYISAMVNNGSLHYEHHEDGTMTQIGGCHALVRNMDVPTRVAVTYVGTELIVYFDNEGTAQWKTCFKAKGVHLPTGYFFGISASTSDVSDNHDILKVTALDLDEEDADWQEKSEVIPEVENLLIPQEYHKEFIEKMQKLEKKNEIRKEKVKEESKRETHESKVKEIPKSEDMKIESEPEETVGSEAEETSSPSLIRKLVYITGTIAMILVSISMLKKYNERRRVRIEKRLY